MSRSRTRPTRDETRQRLFAAAATVFVRSGIAGASVEDICLEADLTRGAMYSNFANKDELVMAMIDEHLDREIAELDRLLETAASPTEYLQLLESPERRRDGPLGPDPVLYMEFTLYAVRNVENRPRIAEHQRRWRDAVAEVVRRDSERLGIEPPMPIDDAAAMILAMDNGYLLGELIEPGSYRPGTFSRNLLALQALWAAGAPAQPRPARKRAPSRTS
ncbi:MAG: TetR/AcrR family transcriptional regulator [Ilumatobacteraceae bacterium]